MSRSRHALITRTAISPRLATRSLVNIDLSYERNALRSQCRPHRRRAARPVGTPSQVLRGGRIDQLRGARVGRGGRARGGRRRRRPSERRAREARTDVALGARRHPAPVGGVEASAPARSLRPSQRCRLKWPNDVTISGRKVAGILLESRMSTAGVPAVVCGIGINVRWTKLPEELGGRATSLALEGSEVDRAVLTGSLLLALEKACGRLDEENGSAEIIERATALSEVLGRTVEARVGGVLGLGLASALTAAGGLVLDTAEGRRVLDAGEIERLRPA